MTHPPFLVLVRMGFDEKDSLFTLLGGILDWKAEHVKGQDKGPVSLGALLLSCRRLFFGSLLIDLLLEMFRLLT